MPPRGTRNRDTETTHFGRAHPSIQRALLIACEASPFLTIATTLSITGIWKRPVWQRNILWRAALCSLLSRWILVGCAITWTWNHWEPAGEDEADEELDLEIHRQRVRDLQEENRTLREETRALEEENQGRARRASAAQAGTWGEEGRDDARTALDEEHTAEGHVGGEAQATSADAEAASIEAGASNT